jgi:hypothetical protein
VRHQPNICLQSRSVAVRCADFIAFTVIVRPDTAPCVKHRLVTIDRVPPELSGKPFSVCGDVLEGTPEREMYPEWHHDRTCWSPARRQTALPVSPGKLRAELSPFSHQPQVLYRPR